jgi:outer membrane autotransporter protein
MTNRRIAVRALAAATALTAFAAPAAAQNVDRIIAFGDSYADTSIAKAVILADPLAPASLKAQISQTYPSGRFSGGSNYIDSLSQILGVPVENYAVGGALAGTFPVPFGTGSSNNTTCGPGVVAGSPAICPLGFTFEVNQFLNTAPDATFFPTGGGTFNADDLVTVSIGGNDARYYQLNYSSMAVAPFLAGSIAAANSGLDRLVAAGAPTISFLAGDTGRLPEIAGNTAAQAIRSSYSTAFNSAMQTTLAGYAARGVMVHYLDLNAVLDNVVANPAAYGLTSAGPCPAAQATTCVTSTSFADQYLFYVDGLHLSSQGFRVVAKYIATQLGAPMTLAATSDTGLDTARQFGRTLTRQMDLAAPRDGDMPEGLRAYIVGDTLTHKYEDNSRTDSFKATTSGLTAGIDYGFGSGLIGIAGNLSKPKANFYNDAARTETESFQLGGYAGAGIAGGFVQGYLGFGWNDHDQTRRGVVRPLDANYDSTHRLAGIKAGLLVPMGDVRVGPVAALDHARVKVDGYTETGDAALALNVSDIRGKSLRGSLGAELRGDFAPGGMQLRPYFAAVAEKEFDDNGRTFRFSQTSAPGIVNRWTIGDVSNKVYGRISGGMSAAILKAVKLDVSMGTTIGQDDSDETNAHLGLSMAF